jgi:hypothetical protein
MTRLTVAQALIRFLAVQHSARDGAQQYRAAKAGQRQFLAPPAEPLPEEPAPQQPGPPGLRR